MKQLIEKLSEELTRERQVTKDQILGMSRHYSVATFEDLEGFVQDKIREGQHL